MAEKRKPKLNLDELRFLLAIEDGCTAGYPVINLKMKYTDSQNMMNSLLERGFVISKYEKRGKGHANYYYWVDKEVEDELSRWEGWAEEMKRMFKDMNYARMRINARKEEQNYVRRSQ